MSSDKLRLRAGDPEDLAVIAACLQDARISIREMVYFPPDKRFIAAFTRYRRERQPDMRSCEGLTECLSALVFDGIDQVRFRGLDPKDQDKELVLLTIATEPGRKHLMRIDLVFEGDARIRLLCESIAARLDDFGDALPCAVTPCDHEASVLPGWTESYDYKA